MGGAWCLLGLLVLQWHVVMVVGPVLLLQRGCQSVVLLMLQHVAGFGFL